MKKKLLIKFLSVLTILCTITSVQPLAANASTATTTTTDATTTKFKGSCYTATVDYSGVRFRSSAKISSSNIIRIFKKGEKLQLYQTDINCKKADGHSWCYVTDSNGKSGYVASDYISTDGIE